MAAESIEATNNSEEQNIELGQSFNIPQVRVLNGDFRPVEGAIVYFMDTKAPGANGSIVNPVTATDDLGIARREY